MKTEIVGILINSLVPGGAEMQTLLMAKTIKENTKYKPVVFGLTGGGKLEELLNNEQIEYFVLNFNLGKFHKSHFHKIYEFIRIAKIFRKFNVKILFTRTYYPNIVGNIAGFFALINNRFWFQVNVEWNKRKSLVEKIAIKLTKKFLANSADAKQYIVDTYNKKQTSITIVSNIYFERKIENTQDFWREKLNFKETDIIISLMSNFFIVKDHKTAIKVFKLLSQKYDNLKMIFSGYSPEKCNLFELKAMAYDLGLFNKLIFINSTNDVQGLLSITDICLFTSIKEHTEGSPNIILDYMLSKKPIVASNIGPIRELFINLNKDFIYEPENEFSLTEKLELLIQNKDLRILVGKANYEYVFKNHNSEIYKQHILKIIESL